MKVLLVILSVVLPITMYFLQRFKEWFRLIFNLVAIGCSVVFGNIAAISIYNVIVDDTVFMTKIHAIFLNPFFLLTGGYLGVYLIYQLILITVRDKH